MALSSLFTGLSGIQVHQTRTNVVADNIANINTTGFKVRRANFQDLLTQTIKEATGPVGSVSGTNPVEIGTGVRLKSVETIFTQGSVQFTGRDTDLAIEGAGFFILSDGNSRYYTRDGAFAFDALGRLVNTGNGMIVQGNLADSEGEFGATTGLANIQVDLNQEIPGLATSRVHLSGNIDPGPVSALSTGTEFVTASTVSTTGFPASLAAEQKLEILIATSETLITGLITIPDATYQTIDKFVDAVNAAISGNERLSGKVIAQKDPDDPTNVQLRTTFGGPNVQIALSDVGTGTALSTLGFAAASAGTGKFAGRTVTAGSTSAVATTATSLNDLAQIGSFLGAGDILRFSGTRSDGTSFDGTFAYDPAATPPQTTISSFLSSVATAFGDDVTGGLTLTGKIELSDSDGNAVTGFTVNTTLDDSGDASGVIGAGGLKQHKISTTVFDSQGRSHTMDVTMAETPVYNKWTWNVKIDNQSPTEGGSGTAIFDEDGTIRTFVPTEGEGTVLTFAPDGEVLPLKIDFTGAAQPDRGITGLTQFSSPATADVVDQDGRASGRLESIFFRNDGVIEGVFSNGETLNMARVNLANFDNPGGLGRLGGNIFVETENTGNPLIEIPTKTIASQIIPQSLEISNVDLAQELTDLITSQRGFQANARVVTTTDEIMTETVNLKR